MSLLSRAEIDIRVAVEVPLDAIPKAKFLWTQDPKPPLRCYSQGQRVSLLWGVRV